MGVKVITPPTQAITTADMRLHCRLDSVDTTENTLLVALLAAAVAYCQHYTGQSIGEQTLELALDEFPADSVELTNGPVASVTSLKYLDSAGVEQTLSTSLYLFDDYGPKFWLVPVIDTTWPVTYATANAVKVRYVAGSIPAAVRAALLLTVGHWYESREASTPGEMKELPLGVKALLDTVKSWGF